MGDINMKKIMLMVNHRSFILGDFLVLREKKRTQTGFRTHGLNIEE